MARMQDKRLLICDDEPAFGRFVKNVAEDLGYEVEVTTTWQTFMQMYLAFRPTTIVTRDLECVRPADTRLKNGIFETPEGSSAFKSDYQDSQVASKQSGYYEAAQRPLLN